MRHIDEEALALMALGESPSPSDLAHLRTCALCSRELDALRYVVATAKSATVPENDLVAPPPGLWHSIAGGLGMPRTPDGASGSGGTEHTGRPHTADDDTTAPARPPVPRAE